MRKDIVAPTGAENENDLIQRAAFIQRRVKEFETTHKHIRGGHYTIVTLIDAETQDQFVGVIRMKSRKDAERFSAAGWTCETRSRDGKFKRIVRFHGKEVFYDQN